MIETHGGLLPSLFFGLLFGRVCYHTLFQVDNLGVSYNLGQIDYSSRSLYSSYLHFFDAVGCLVSRSRSHGFLVSGDSYIASVQFPNSSGILGLPDMGSWDDTLVCLYGILLIPVLGYSPFWCRSLLYVSG